MANEASEKTCEQLKEEAREDLCQIMECLTGDNGGTNTKLIVHEIFGGTNYERMKEFADILKCWVPESNGKKKYKIHLDEQGNAVPAGDPRACSIEEFESKEDDPDACPTRFFGLDYVGLVKYVNLIKDRIWFLGDIPTPPAGMECPMLCLREMVPTEWVGDPHTHPKWDTIPDHEKIQFDPCFCDQQGTEPKTNADLPKVLVPSYEWLETFVYGDEEPDVQDCCPGQYWVREVKGPAKSVPSTTDDCGPADLGSYSLDNAHAIGQNAEAGTFYGVSSTTQGQDNFGSVDFTEVSGGDCDTVKVCFWRKMFKTTGTAEYKLDLWVDDTVVWTDTGEDPGDSDGYLEVEVEVPNPTSTLSFTLWVNNIDSEYADIAVTADDIEVKPCSKATTTSIPGSSFCEVSVCIKEQGTCGEKIVDEIKWPVTYEGKEYANYTELYAAIGCEKFDITPIYNVTVDGAVDAVLKGNTFTTTDGVKVSLSVSDYMEFGKYPWSIDGGPSTEYLSWRLSTEQGAAPGEVMTIKYDPPMPESGRQCFIDFDGTENWAFEGFDASGSPMDLTFEDPMGTHNEVSPGVWEVIDNEGWGGSASNYPQLTQAEGTFYMFAPKGLAEVKLRIFYDEGARGGRRFAFTPPQWGEPQELVEVRCSDARDNVTFTDANGQEISIDLVDCKKWMLVSSRPPQRVDYSAGDYPEGDPTAEACPDGTVDGDFLIAGSGASQRIVAICLGGEWVTTPKFEEVV